MFLRSSLHTPNIAKSTKFAHKCFLHSQVASHQLVIVHQASVNAQWVLCVSTHHISQNPIATAQSVRTSSAIAPLLSYPSGITTLDTATLARAVDVIIAVFVAATVAERTQAAVSTGRAAIHRAILQISIAQNCAQNRTHSMLLSDISKSHPFHHIS